MERHQERDLEILTAIDEGRPLTQRALAQRLGMALGLTNLYLKRLAKKGLIKITEFPRKPAARKRLRYVVTPKGLLEKTRLTYDYMTYSLGVYRRTRETLRETLSHLPGDGTKRVVLYGVGEAARECPPALRPTAARLHRAVLVGRGPAAPGELPGRRARRALSRAHGPHPRPGARRAGGRRRGRRRDGAGRALAPEPRRDGL